MLCTINMLRLCWWCSQGSVIFFDRKRLGKLTTLIVLTTYHAPLHMWHITRVTRSSILHSTVLTNARAFKTTGSRSLFYNLTKNRKSIIINSPQIFINAYKYCTAPKNNSSEADPVHNSLPRRFAREVAQYFQTTAEKARASEGLFGYIVTHAPAALQPYLYVSFSLTINTYNNTDDCCG